MDYGFVSCIPILVLITGALLTKKIGESMIVASVVGVAIVYKGGFFDGYVDTMYEVLTNESYQFILFIVLCFGAAVKLFQASGCLIGFGNLISKVASGPKNPLLLALLTNVIMFMDDYMNTLGVSFSMREVTDRNHIPREHLAFQTAVMAPALCVLMPFSSWAAFTAAGIFPKLGNLKKAYERVNGGGSVLPPDDGEKALVSMEMDDNIESSSALNFILPIPISLIYALKGVNP